MRFGQLRAWRLPPSVAGETSIEDGYLGYARMVAASKRYEEARRAYNAEADSLLGDSGPLDAQDELREARLRDREARLAFLPELSRRCLEIGVPVPQDDAVALESLKDELIR